MKKKTAIDNADNSQDNVIAFRSDLSRNFTNEIDPLEEILYNGLGKDAPENQPEDDLDFKSRYEYLFDDLDSQIKFVEDSQKRLDFLITEIETYLPLKGK